MVNTRKIALMILEDVRGGAYLNLVLKNRLNGMEPQERRFVSALCFTTLENIIRIDYVIKQFTDGCRIQGFAKSVLRLGVCQLMFFENVPQSAAVNECVKLIAQSPKRGLKGFVNAVLRRVASESVVYPDRETAFPEFLSVMYSYPIWLVEKFIADYGESFTEELVSYRREEAEICIRPQHLPFEYIDGLQIRRGEYSKSAYYAKGIHGVDELAAFKQGKIAVQGEASMLCVEAAGIKSGDRVLDICAAPGGKSAYTATFEPSRLVCADIHPHRVELIKRNFERLHVTAETLIMDATQLHEEFREAFDVVLVDSPCSALGLLYRKPDIVRTLDELPKLAELQRSILNTAAEYVRPGGVLLYSTCTINREENTSVIENFLINNTNYSKIGLREHLPPNLAPRVREDCLQLFPHIDGIDGFFICRLVKGV